MRPPVKPVPDGYSTVTAHLCIKGAAEALDFYKKAFGADELCRLDGPDGTLMHAEMSIGNSIIMINDEFPESGKVGPATLGGSTVTLHLYVEDCDAVFDRAVKSGGQPAFPCTDMFWGDRYGVVIDPFGHHWGIATHIEDVSDEQIRERVQQMAAQAPSS